MKLRQAMAESVNRLAASGLPKGEAEQLVLGVTGLRRTALFSHGDYSLSAPQAALLEEWLQRRLDGEPLAYILGQREFYGLTFKVSPAVLIPRPDTETLVDWALELIPKQNPWKIGDLGTGSGCIAISLASERPEASLLATDQSPEALRIAEHNAARNGIENILFHEGDWLSGLKGQFEMIASNPPYIDGSSPYLQKGDLTSEPTAALTPGADGLQAIRQIIKDAPRHLEANGWLLLEHGFDQGAAVRKLLKEAGFKKIETRQDLTGNDRVSGGQIIY